MGDTQTSEPHRQSGEAIMMQGDYSPDALGQLLFRRQFYLGPRHLDQFPSWTRVGVGDTYCLTAHPDLGVAHATDGRKSVTLVGYMLDPAEPHAGNADVAEALVRKLQSCRGSWVHTADFGGRWILIVHDGRDTVLFHDAAGLRSVHYARAGETGATVCASRPSLIAETLGLERHEEAWDFVTSQDQDECDVYWMPGDTALYARTRCLLPNHYLDLRTGEAHRYWPDADLRSLPLADAVAESLRMLRGLVLGARHRSPLALSMTAGWDSRLMLSLAKALGRDLYCFTLAYPGSENSRDVRVPAALLARLGLEHTVVGYPAQINLDFKTTYQRNVAAEGHAYCADAQALYEHYPAGRMCMTGDVAEIVKCHYRPPAGRETPATATGLAELCGIRAHPFLLNAFETWLEGAVPRNIPLLDLFCWEQFAGRKQALIRSQYDIVHDSFAPLNCRTLLVTMLSVSERYRCGPDFALLRTLVEELWRETLSVPVNPDERTQAKRVIRGVLDALKLYDRVPESLKELGRRVMMR
ncbi:MAG: hypothetical protein AB1806_16095 [Acidobacteriota bacterium]